MYPSRYIWIFYFCKWNNFSFPPLYKLYKAFHLATFLTVVLWAIAIVLIVHFLWFNSLIIANRSWIVYRVRLVLSTPRSDNENDYEIPVLLSYFTSFFFPSSFYFFPYFMQESRSRSRYLNGINRERLPHSCVRPIRPIHACLYTCGYQKWLWA
jgi:hypothetical protein